MDLLHEDFYKKNTTVKFLYIFYIYNFIHICIKKIEKCYIQTNYRQYRMSSQSWIVDDDGNWIIVPTPIRDAWADRVLSKPVPVSDNIHKVTLYVPGNINHMTDSFRNKSSQFQEYFIPQSTKFQESYSWIVDDDGNWITVPKSIRDAWADSILSKPVPVINNMQKVTLHIPGHNNQFIDSFRNNPSQFQESYRQDNFDESFVHQNEKVNFNEEQKIISTELGKNINFLNDDDLQPLNCQKKFHELTLEEKLFSPNITEQVMNSSYDIKDKELFLFLAIQNGEIEELEKMYEEDNTIVTSKIFNESTLPISLAIGYSKWEVALWLFSKGANVDIIDDKGKNFIHILAEKEWSFILTIVIFNILERTENKNLINEYDNDGNTPLHIAIIKANVNFVLCLLDRDILNLPKKSNSTLERYTLIELAKIKSFSSESGKIIYEKLNEKFSGNIEIF